MTNAPDETITGAEPATALPLPLQLMRRTLRLTRLPLYRSASALIVSNISNGLSGLIYWVLVARLFPTEAVGQGAAGISALLLVSQLGWPGLQGTLIRFIPTTGRATKKLVVFSYAVATVAALTAGCLLLLCAVFFLEPLNYLTNGVGLGFLLAIVAWTIYSLGDGVMIGLRRSVWVTIDNTAFGFLRIALLLGLSFITESPWAIFASWSLTAALVIFPINILLFFKFIPTHQRENPNYSGFKIQEIVRFSAANQVSATLTGLPDALMPLIVIGVAGAQANAYFYAPRTVIMALRLFAVSISNSFTVEGAVAGDAFKDLLQKAALFTAALFLPLTVLLIVGSPVILQIFGSEYAENGVTLMRLFAIGLIPFAVANLCLGIARVRRFLGRLILVATISATLNLTLAVYLLLVIGLEGAGVAWLLAQTAAAIVAFSLIARPARAVPNAEAT